MNIKSMINANVGYQQDDIYPEFPAVEDILIHTTRMVRKIKGQINNKDIIRLLLFKLETEPNPVLRDRYRSALRRIACIAPDDE